MTHVLVGDIGGTKTWLAVFDGRGELIRETKFESGAFERFEDALDAFSAGAPIAAAAFGVAGPVTPGKNGGREVHTTNLPWTIRESELRFRLQVPITLLNDFEAAALGSNLAESVVLQSGQVEADGPRLIVGAGTGLGKAVILPAKENHVLARVLRSEGGHVGFAPRNADDAALLAFVRQKAEEDHVPLERLVSGVGIATIYAYLTQSTSPKNDGEMDGAEVSARAAQGDPQAARAIEWFVQLYGSAIGDFALDVLPTGGLFIAGGIAPKLHAADPEGFAKTLLGAMRNKGAMAPLIDTTRVALITDERVGLLGAARAALESLKR